MQKSCRSECSLSVITESVHGSKPPSLIWRRPLASSSGSPFGARRMKHLLTTHSFVSGLHDSQSASGDAPAQTWFASAKRAAGKSSCSPCRCFTISWGRPVHVDPKSSVLTGSGSARWASLSLWKASSFSVICATAAREFFKMNRGHSVAAIVVFSACVYGTPSTGDGKSTVNRLRHVRAKKGCKNASIAEHAFDPGLMNVLPCVAIGRCFATPCPGGPSFHVIFKLLRYWAIFWFIGLYPICGCASADEGKTPFSTPLRAQSRAYLEEHATSFCTCSFSVIATYFANSVSTDFRKAVTAGASISPNFS